MFFFGYEMFPRDQVSSKRDFETIFLAVACISQGILLSAVQHVFFDVNMMKYKKQYQVGFRKVGNGKNFLILNMYQFFDYPRKTEILFT